MEPAAECEECNALEDRYRVSLRAYTERIWLDFEAVRRDYQTHLRGHDGSSPR